MPPPLHRGSRHASMSVILNTRVGPGRNVPVGGEVEGGEDMNGGEQVEKKKKKWGHVMKG
jgi:hypothetical protein